MDLIYADQNRKDIGILDDYKYDLAYGVDENDFTLEVDISMHLCQTGYYTYMVDTQNGIEQPTEYGGIIDAIAVDTSARKVTYSGRTWHGILSKRVICPEKGQDYKIVTGNAHEIIQDLIKDAGLSAMFTVDGETSPISVPEYQFKRYTDLYSGICDMLAANGGKLKVVYANKRVVLSVDWLVDYSKDEEWDSSQVDFTIKQDMRPVNHLVCMGQGDLHNRAVIHLFADENGGVQPYAFVNNPLKDSDYILDTRKQIMAGMDEVAEAYDNSSAEITENYVLLSSQPSDWARNYASYYKKTEDGENFEEIVADTAEVLTLLSSQPSDWSTAYGNYYTSDGKSVQGVTVDNYISLANKPADWNKNWTDYYVYFWDGVQGYWNKVESITWYEYVVQTKQPTDWETSYSSYYEHDTFEYGVIVNNKLLYKTATKGTGYKKVEARKKGKKTVAPTWVKNRYYTQYSHSKAPNFAKETRYRLEKVTSAPTWAANTYYTKTTKIIVPKWANNMYYVMYEDRYAALVNGGIEHLKDAAQSADSIKINLDLLGEYDVGDIVGANENVTGIAVWQPITKKIVSIKNNQKTISYQIGASK